MNAWLFAGCMFLVAVGLNMLLLFSQRIIKKVRNKKYKSQNKLTD
ncbi:hypothetical protein [Bacillus pseudomycoides]|nr:hypothetical protein [Bacillus pseudomycoides]